MISALKLRQDPSPHLSKLFSSEYPSAATFLVDTPTDVLPKKNRRYGVDDLDARVNEIANAIQRTAGKASLGDRICFIKENHFDVVVLAVAISRAGFVPIVVSDSASDDDFQALVAKSNPKLVLLGGRFDSYTDHQIQTLSIERPFLSVQELTSLSDNEEITLRDPRMSVPQDSHTLMLVTHSSGTTGLPKLVCHSASSMRGATEVELSHFPFLQIGRKDTVVANISFFHSRAFCWTFAQLKWQPKLSCAVGSYDYTVMQEALRGLHPTIFESLPNVMARNLWILKKQPDLFSRIRVFLNTYDMMHPSIARDFMRATRNRAAIWLHSWGQSETGPIAAGFYSRKRLLNRKRPLSDMNTMGWPWFGKIQIKIVDPNNPDRSVQKGQQGVAVVRSKSITTGYLGDEDHYQGKWHKGWWNTGDIVYLDKLLRIRFVDRNADKFSDHSLTHMESALLQQLPAAQEIILLPVARQELVPVAIPNAGETSQFQEQWSLVDIPNVILRDPVLLTWDQIPLTSTWKIRRRNLMQNLGLNIDWIDRRYA